jgi:crotonobetainyl-CoA:carnitine CoA-transferase CaiB-like acyl-CoA transferase
MPAPSPGGPLAGLRVIDMTSTFMGPYCTMLLGQWGADVVKVEPPAGDVVRYIGDHRGTGMGPVFLNTNRGKRSVVLDLKRPGAAEVLGRLIGWCDVLVHNLRPAAAQRAGLSGAAVLARNPAALLLAFRGFAAGGPSADDPAYDDIIQARSGLAALQGGAGEPGYVRSSIADKIVGAFGAAAVLAALRERDRTGQGGVVDIPMLETMVGFNLLEQQGGLTFDPATGPGGYSRTSSPYRRPYATKDGSIGVMVYTDAQWRAFFELSGHPELADNPDYRTIRERTLHSDELYERVDRLMRDRSTAEWLDVLGAHGIPASPVNAVADLFTDPQLAATGFFHAVRHPTEGDLVLGAVTGPVGQQPPASRWWAPRLGADTGAVLAELGYDEEQCAALLRQGAVGDDSGQPR